ncbi:glutathione S-transferase family protein [Gloeobacter violaceus]|uniref:Gll3450 protein n=1 Tax=Gloeobacter violaceus (strain ATCC 29082 / PCC 7421) TaxID=251221 RepID=Q7NFS4_GLOVI|nr:glutathione S-transferase family protein [Gloeobacter violaceus]BAC91391.1 gll3450 [Gloeobacter violaceus PCC 7421]
MALPLLVIGNKNYSSWSLRPWLALKQAGYAFEELRISLDTAETRAQILTHSPSGKVPVLIDGGLRIWESLAICEYVAEQLPEAGLWPADPAVRAVARSVSCEMHAGFAALRAGMPMDTRARHTGWPMSPAVMDDIDRIANLWRCCRMQYGGGGDFLFGRFTIADAMYAPVVTRFMTYGVLLDEDLGRYCQALLALAPFQQWLEAARQEPETLAVLRP